MTRSTNDDGKLTWVFHHVDGHTTNYVDMNAIIWCLGGDQCENEQVPGSPSFVFTT
jgi:hypothetical protein